MRPFLLAAMLGLLCLLSPPKLSFAQNQANASMSGFITDATSGETLILANVVLEGTTLGAATNNAGYYTLTGLTPGTYTVVASFLGFQNYRETLTLAPGENRRLDIALDPAGVEIDEVLVTAERELDEEARRVGTTQLKVAQVRQLPTILEPDVFRSLQLLPGVKAASDFSSGLYIRGGGPDQTLILLDRTTVYNPTHFFGLFSTFNPDAIKDVRLYKGGYPATYGGRLGSVVDIYNKDGNRNETHGTASIGLLASRVMVEGPYRKGSWMLAVRRSTIDPILAVLRNADVAGIPELFYFLDANGKLNIDLTQNDKISLSFYAGQDVVDNLAPLDDANIDLRYGNRTVSANWTHIFSNRLFSNFTLTGSRYFNEPEFEFGGSEFARVNDVYDYSAKGDFEFVPNDRHATLVGFWSGIFTFRLLDRFDFLETLSERIQAPYGAFYVQHTYKPRPDWEFQGGVRANYFGEGNFTRFEPRLSIEHRPTANVRLQAGYGRYYQFLTLITNQTFSGFDIWLTTGRDVPPAAGDQFVGGVKTNLRDGLNFDVEVYYRTMNELFELDPFLPDAAGFDYADLFHFGEGFAYGTEWLLEKTTGRLNGFIGYTASTTRRRFPNLKDGDFFPPKYDRLHDVKVVANYDIRRFGRLCKRESPCRVTGVFSYGTGQAYTEPTSQYKLLDSPFASDVPDVLDGTFNEARLPAYHRLDAGFTKVGRFFGIGTYEFQLQLINVYARRNLWFIFFEFDDENRVERNEVPQIPVPIPNIALTVKF